MPTTYLKISVVSYAILNSFRRAIGLNELFKEFSILCLILLLLPLSAYAQLGNTHYIAPLHPRLGINNAAIYASPPNGDAANPVVVTIRTGNGTLVQTLNIFNGQEGVYELPVTTTSPIRATSVELNNIITGKGYIIEGTEDIYITLKISIFDQAEYLVAKGADALGTRFRLGSAPQINDPGRNTYVGIMATEDNTTVTLSEFDPGVVFENGPLLNPVLMAGETFVLAINPEQATANLEGFIGALVTSDKPIVVNTGNLLGNSVSNGTRDYLLDQNCR